MRHKAARIITTLVLGAMLSGCALATRRTSVADLKYNPGRYQDKTVSIDGVVTSSWGMPLVPQGGRTPSRGAHVRVKGRVEKLATFGGQSLGLHLQERDLDFKGR